MFFSQFCLFLAVQGLHCCVRACSSCGEQGLLSSCSVVASLAAEHGLQGTWTSVVVGHRLSFPWHLGSSRARDRTCVLCIGMWILNCWTTREVLDIGGLRPWLVFLHAPASEHQCLIFPAKYWEKDGLALPWVRAPVTCSGLAWQMTEIPSFTI